MARVAVSPSPPPKADARGDTKPDTKSDTKPDAKSAAAVASDLLAAVASVAQVGGQSNASARTGAPADGSSDRLEQASRRIGDWFSWVAASGLTGLAHQLAYNAELSDHRATATGLELDLALPEKQRHLAEKLHQDKLKDALAQTLHVPVRLTIEIGGAGDTSAAAADRRARAKAQDDATASFNADPFVRDTVRLFDGRVRSQTIQPVSGPAASKGTKQ